MPAGRCQAIIWTNAGILLIGPLGTNFNEILIEINTFSSKKIHFKLSSGKWRPFCLDLNVLMILLSTFRESMHIYRKISNIRRIKSPNLNVSRLVLQLSLPNTTRTTRTPALWGYPHRLMITHTIESYWIPSQKKTVKVTNLKNSPKFQIFEFWNRHYTRHTFFSCLIRCANMKWIRWVLLKIQSGHGFVHRRTDRRTDRRTRWYQYTPLSTSLKWGV